MRVLLWFSMTLLPSLMGAATDGGSVQRSAVAHSAFEAAFSGFWAGTVPPPLSREVRRTELWVSLVGAGAVAVLDASTGKELRRIPVGASPTYVKISPNGRWAAVTNSVSNTVSIISTDERTVVRTVATGRTPKGVNWSPDSRQLWVVNEGAEPGSLWVYSVPGFERIASVEVQRAPHNVVLTQDGALAFVTNTGSRTISVVDVSTFMVRDTIPVDGAVHNLTLEPGDGRLFVTLTDRSKVAVVSIRDVRVVGSIPVVVGHHVPAVDGHENLVVGGFSGAVSLVRLGTGGTWITSDTLTLSPGTHGVAFGPLGTAFIVAMTGNYVAEVDPVGRPTLRRKIPVPGGPFTVSVRLVFADGESVGPRSGTAS